MMIVFTLTMPNRGSWNGQWSGEGPLYAIVRDVRPNGKAMAIVEDRDFYYNFGDGWGANVHARESAGATETKRIRKKSKGFCGYDWMVASILIDGDIIAPSDRKKMEAKQ